MLKLLFLIWKIQNSCSLYLIMYLKKALNYAMCYKIVYNQYYYVV